MPIAPGTYPIGPEQGALQVRTSREGVAAKLGHDLLIEFRRWSGLISVTDTQRSPGGVQVEVEVEMEMGSLAILEGTGGAVGLSDHDRREISATAHLLLSVDQFPTARFASDRVLTSAVPGGAVIDGTLTLRGRSEPVTVTLTCTGELAWQGTATVSQGAFGIKPYRAFFGALRLADPVGVEVTVNVDGRSDASGHGVSTAMDS
jgi:polyisoprenoid-binding protein YceI